MSSLKNLAKVFKTHNLLTLKTWKLVLVFLALTFILLTYLRLDHLRMSRLRDDVFAADSAGDDDALAASLNRLRDFAFSHIIVSRSEENGNSSLKLGTGPFYLEASYRRSAASVLEQASSLELDGSNPNGNIYSAVSEICRPRAIANGWTWDSPEHVSCWTEELAKYPSEEVLNDKITATLPSTELYRREYSSPLFCFCLTFFVLVLTLLCFLLLFLRFLIWIILWISVIISNPRKTS